MNWIRLLRTTVTHHRKLEQVDIHLQKKGLFVMLIFIIGIRDTSSVIFTNFVCVLSPVEFLQTYFVTHRTCCMRPYYRTKNCGEGVLGYKITSEIL